jgi:hypothetical protein
MLNKVTRKILGDLSSINQSMIISYPTTVVKTGQSLQAYIDLDKFGEDAFEEIGIYNINELNSVINVIDNAEVELDGKVLKVKGTKSNISYTTTSIGIIETECRGNPDLIERIKNNTLVLSTSLEGKELEKVKKTSSILGTSDLVVKGSDNVISLIAQSKEKSSNKYEVSLDGSTVENVEMIIPMEMINRIPNGSYDMKVYKSAKGSLVSILEDKDRPGLSIVVSARSV